MMSDVSRTYDAPPTLQRFHASDAPLRFVRGPVGSGKTVGMIMELFRRCCEIPPSSDGVRRSRVCVTRNTLQQLTSTCLVSIMEWLRPVARWKVSDKTVIFDFVGSDGVPVYSEWLLLPLDTPENQQRLLSLELTMGWASECREIPLEIVQALYSRCGRYPSRANIGGDYYYGVIAETNSFSEDSPYYEYLELKRPAMVDYFVQPGGMDPDAENRKWLPKRYYEDLLETNDEAWCSQYVHNKITESLSGQAVFAKSFKPDFHCTDNPLYVVPGRPVVIGMDTGRNPAAVFGQLDNWGRLLVFGSIFAENMGMESFLSTRVKPFIADRFQGGEFVVSIDPAARQRSQIGEESVLSAVRRLGFAVQLAPTNDVSPRLRAVERFFNLQIDGKAGILLQREHNEDLILALKSGYRYKRTKDGNLEEKPDKRHPDSDLADALQYLCLNAGLQSGSEIAGKRREIRVVSAAGWS